MLKVVVRAPGCHLRSSSVAVTVRFKAVGGAAELPEEKLKVKVREERAFT
jgi:hypothetical protein